MIVTDKVYANTARDLLYMRIYNTFAKHRMHSHCCIPFSPCLTLLKLLSHGDYVQMYILLMAPGRSLIFVREILVFCFLLNLIILILRVIQYIHI